MTKSPKYRLSLVAWSLLALGTLFVTAFLVERWGETTANGSADDLFLQGYGYAEPNSSTSFRKMTQKGRNVTTEYGFTNFNKDKLRVDFSFSARELESYRLEYGYTPDDFDALLVKQRQDLDEAYQYVVKNRQSQLVLDRMSEKIKAEYKQNVRNLIKSRGFKYRNENLVVPDIPGIVKKNISNLRPLAVEISQLARKNSYNAADVVGATLSLMQTGLVYENIPMQDGDRVIGGIYPPVVAVVEGRGDCDSKTAVMASVLLNWDKTDLVGVGVPGHYLIGVLQVPGRGDAYVEYNGLNYVLMEPAGPAHLSPGVVSSYTLSILNAGDDQVVLEPLKRN
jgi:hypothetical protein